MDSTWWDRPIYEPDAWRSSGLLGGDKYDYDAPHAAGQHVPRLVSELDMEVSVDEYMPPGLSREEGIEKAMKDFELVKLA
jgi:hypothetical protein